MRQIFKLLYWLMSLPSLSILQYILGAFVQNRILWLPFGIYALRNRAFRTISSLMHPFLFLCVFWGIYVFFALILGWNVLLYFGYFFTGLLILLSGNVIILDRNLYLKFFNLFFVANGLFVLFQIFTVNVGLGEYSMIQSNLAVQTGGNYIPPVFITKPFIRYSGLFNESSPYAFYLCICFCFYKIKGHGSEKYLFWDILLLVFSGSKFAYLFILSYLMFFSGYKIVKIIASIATISIITLILTDLKLLIEITGGEVASIHKRLDGLLGISDNGISLLGEGLKSSSNGDVELNMFSILIGGFGIMGTIIIFLALFRFYTQIKFNRKIVFVLPFIIGIVSNGSLLIVQYSLIIYSLLYFHYENREYKLDRINIRK